MQVQSLCCRLSPGDGTGIRVCLRSRILRVQISPGRLNGELPLIGKGAVLKTAVFRHLGVQVSHSPLLILSQANWINHWTTNPALKVQILPRVRINYLWLYHSLVNEPVYQTGYLGSNPSSHLPNAYVTRVWRRGRSAKPLCLQHHRWFKSNHKLYISLV